MDIPSANKIKPGARFLLQTPNGIVEFRALKTTFGKGESRHMLTLDGITLKQVVPQAHCSVQFKGEQFNGIFSMVHPLDNGTWAVRAEFKILSEDFWQNSN